MNSIKLVEQMQAVAPVNGMSVDDPLDKSTWKILFHESATTEQRAAAQQIIDQFDVNTEVARDKAANTRRISSQKNARLAGILSNLLVEDVDVYMDTNVISVTDIRELLRNILKLLIPMRDETMQNLPEDELPAFPQEQQGKIPRAV